jgi:large subunit ribosomal protein L16
MAGVEEELAREALTLALHKLPFQSKIISQKDSNEVY